MRKVTILFSTTKSFSLKAFILRTKLFGMGTPYSHVSLMIHSQTYDSTLIYEASAHGIRIDEFSHWTRNNRIIHQTSIHISEEKKLSLVRYCIKNLGIKKTTKEMLLEWFLINLKGFFRRKNTPPKSSVCSTLALNLLKDEIDSLYKKIESPLPKNLECMEPNELFSALLAAERTLEKNLSVSIS